MNNEYIEKGALLEVLGRNSIIENLTYSDGKTLREKIEELPAANVFEAQPIDIDEYKFTHIYGDVRVKTQTLEDYYKFKRGLKDEIASEIFEEAEKIFMSTWLSFEAYKAWCELKKKYLWGARK